MKIPMILTLMRLALIPIIIIFFYIPFQWAHIIAAIVFAIGGITDWLDGYLARKLGQSSKFGAFLDPVADKLIVATALVLLVGNPQLPYIAIPSAIIVAREIVVSALREWMAELGKRASVAVCYVSKIKTTVQFLAVIVLLACDPTPPGILMYIGYILLYSAATLTLWTMIMYLKAAWPDLVFKE
jgi:CDP-diacylglycerol--glycerol-3-phosphate 3-phosphatidyltransferase